MSNINQSSNRINNRSWTALLPVLLLAPLAMAPKGCNSVIVGDNCPEDEICTGVAGGAPMGSAGAAGKPSSNNGGAAGKPTGSAGAAGKPTTGSGGSTGGKDCGGLLGLSCAADEYCAFDSSAACGAADQTGVCKAKPQVCGEIYAPVCGCDGQTYENACTAAAKGTSVQRSGACEEPVVVCGGLKPATCAKSEYCKFPIESKCGSGDQTGVCTKLAEACDLSYSPVCGCNGTTYSNDCDAARAGISVLHTGRCAGSSGKTCGGITGAVCADIEFCIYPIEAKCGNGDQTGTCSPMNDGPCPAVDAPVCGCNGKTYSNACIANSSGVSVAANGACDTACGGRLGNTCAAGEYCNYPISAICGRADGTGTCAQQPTGACLANYDPVCGCDGKTYGNACEAATAGVSVSAKGACP